MLFGSYLLSSRGSRLRVSTVQYSAVQTKYPTEKQLHRGKPWGQPTKARYNPAGSGRMKPGEVALGSV